MPSTSQEMLDWANKEFDYSNQECGAGVIERWLKSQGYTLTTDWHWILPDPLHRITKKERLAVLFLCEEWDYGFIFINQRQYDNWRSRSVICL